MGREESSGPINIFEIVMKNCPKFWCGRSRVLNAKVGKSLGHATHSYFLGEGIGANSDLLKLE